MVAKSHHLWLGCCFMCLLSGNARLRLLLQVLDAGPLPDPRSPVLVDAMKLLPSLLCWCMLSGHARLRLLLQVLCQVLDAGPLPGPRSPVLPSAVKLLPSLLCCCKRC